MRPKRKALGGAVVAFIDVMACGLGAVVLLLVIVDFNVDEFVPRVKQIMQSSLVASEPKESEEELELALVSLVGVEGVRLSRGGAGRRRGAGGATNKRNGRCS